MSRDTVTRPGHAAAPPCSDPGVSDAPDPLPDDPEALRALLLAERARHAAELAAARADEPSGRTARSPGCG